MWGETLISASLLSILISPANSQQSTSTNGRSTSGIRMRVSLHTAPSRSTAGLAEDFFVSHISTFPEPATTTSNARVPSILGVVTKAPTPSTKHVISEAPGLLSSAQMQPGSSTLASRMNVRMLQLPSRLLTSTAVRSASIARITMLGERNTNLASGGVTPAVTGQSTGNPAATTTTRTTNTTSSGANSTETQPSAHRPATIQSQTTLLVNRTNTITRSAPPNALGCSGVFTSATIPTSVHTLRVGDVDVVAALGDSLTAGNGALSTMIFDVLTEYRGVAFSIGGDQSFAEGVLTLPNIFKVFNPNVRGFSAGSGGRMSAGSNLNVATAGAIAQSMPSQARTLINRMRSNVNVNYTSDWKVVTMFIGANNLCNYCENMNMHSAASYKTSIEEALDILHTYMPRTLVNLVEVFDLNPVAHLATSNFLCRLVVGTVCPCGVGSSANRVVLHRLALQYQQTVRELIGSGKYDTRADFTVVIQPLFRNISLPQATFGGPDFSYFAPDCFHFSSKGHSVAGKALWNNMVQPLVSKQTDLKPAEPIACPTTEYIPTRLN